MNGIVVVAEIAGGAVRPETFAAISLAQRLREGHAEPVAALVVDPDGTPAAALAMEGVDEILHVPCEAASDAVAIAIVSLAQERSPRLILAGHTVTSVAYGPRVAIELTGGFASGVVDASIGPDGLRALRDVYGGRLRTELAFTGAPTVLLVRMPADPLDAPMPASPPVTKRPAPPANQVRSRHLRAEAPGAGDANLADARFVIGVGRGIGDRENLEVFANLAATMEATLGASRPLVDAGWMSRDRQVGQSGTTIAPAVYLAFGISGAAEHVAGIRGSGTIIAVNSDARAPIFGVASFGAVADALDVADELARRW